MRAYDNAHAYKHEADNSEACCVPQPPKVEKIGTCVVPQFTDYVDIFRLRLVNTDDMPLRVRLTSGREIIFTSLSSVWPITKPLSSAAAYTVGSVPNRQGQPSGGEFTASSRLQVTLQPPRHTPKTSN